MKSFTPHLGNDNEPLYKLNICTNHTRSIRWPPHSYRLVFWPDPGGDICEDLYSRVVKAEHLPLAVVELTNLHSNSKEAMNSLCEEDGLIRRSCSLSVYLNGVLANPVAGRLGLGNELELTHWMLRGSCNGVWLKRGNIDTVSRGGRQLGSSYGNVAHIYTQHESALCISNYEALLYAEGC